MDLQDCLLIGICAASVQDLALYVEICLGLCRLLNGNQLTGPIPLELGNLLNMNRLQLDENLLNGPIPSSFGNFINLRHMYVRRNPSHLASLHQT